MNVSIIISIIGLIISTISVSFAIYIGTKNSKKTDIKDIEQRVAERTETNMKLDEINRNTQEIRYDVTGLKKDVQRHGEKIVEIEASAKQAHHRLDSVENRLNMSSGGDG